MKKLLAACCVAGALVQSGCQTTETDKQAALGAVIGAGAGSVLGHNLGGGKGDNRALGAAAGAVIGGLVANEMAQRDAMQQQMNMMQQQQFIHTVWIENSNGSKTPITLRQTEGGQFIGPRGEYYQGMPSQEQLKKIYGM